MEPGNAAVLEAVRERAVYGVTLVAAPDGPWVADGIMRESAEVRQRVHAMVLATLDERRIPFVLVEGSLPQRLRQVEGLLGTP